MSSADVLWKTAERILLFTRWNPDWSECQLAGSKDVEWRQRDVFSCASDVSSSLTRALVRPDCR